MPEPLVEPVLFGYSAASEQGSIGFGAVYLVRAAGRTILFDCGHVGRRRALLRALDGTRIDTLVLSHAHWDHVQNADLFDQVLIHPDERTPAGDSPFQPPWTAAILAHARDAEPGPLAPGVELIGLPGHTLGSIGLCVETATGTAVLTGDAVPSARALRANRPSSAVDADAAAASMRLVRDRADLVFPGHDRPFRLTT